SEALTAICEGDYTPERIAAWDERLAQVFNRGFWDGYYLGQRLGEWSAKYGSSATRVKVYAAKILRYFPNIGVGEFRLEAGSLSVGDEVVITGPTTGALIFTVSELRVDLKPVQTVTKGDLFSMPVSQKIRTSDRLYRWQPTQSAKA
ncbi:MAG: U32 family peptidase, partial [Muribaculaceae bacterium]|nr:U32 family peptidase [Muribaculaceae bacterium]